MNSSTKVENEIKMVIVPVPGARELISAVAALTASNLYVCREFQRDYAIVVSRCGLVCCKGEIEIKGVEVIRVEIMRCVQPSDFDRKDNWSSAGT